ncbi:MAG: hypothetical protein M3540_12520 [Actinomycetota bacterium]|nr:hypothetical protein [Actinomycetota bacterium]
MNLFAIFVVLLNMHSRGSVELSLPGVSKTERVPSHSATPAQAEQSESREPIFDEAPPELADMSPASLSQLFEGRSTEIQRRSVFMPHVGKEVRVSGRVASVEGGSVGPMVVIKQPNDFTIALFFDAEYNSNPVLLALNHGDNISVSGQIFQSLGAHRISLDKCKDIEVRGPS